jgi:hypothetical protein
VVESGEGSARVWVADQAASAARLRSIKVGMASGDLVEVVEGLNAADRLISGGREGLRDGERVKVTGEDAAIGAAAHSTEPRPARRPGKPAADGGHQANH